MNDRNRKNCRRGSIDIFGTIYYKNGAVISKWYRTISLFEKALGSNIGTAAGISNKEIMITFRGHIIGSKVIVKYNYRFGYINKKRSRINDIELEYWYDICISKGGY